MLEGWKRRAPGFLVVMPAIVTACLFPMLGPADFTGVWTGHASLTPCPGDYDSCRHNAELVLVQTGKTVTGTMTIEGVAHSFAVTSSNPSWIGLDLVGHSDCAELSGHFEYPEGISGDVTIDWMDCPDPRVEEWHMVFRRVND